MRRLGQRLAQTTVALVTSPTTFVLAGAVLVGVGVHGLLGLWWGCVYGGVVVAGLGVGLGMVEASGRQR